MENLLCRLCLKVTSGQLWKLSDECDIISKLRSCLILNLSFHEAFPQQLCKECINQIEQINEFSDMVKENEKKLQQHLINGSLTDLFIRLTNVKEENNVQVLNDYVLVKYEDTKDDVENVAVISQNTKDNVGEVFNEPEIVKEEDIANNDINDNIYSSDEDDVTLSSLKKHKEHENRTETDTKGKHRNTNICTENLTESFNCLTCDVICDSYDKLREHYKVTHTKKSEEMVKPMYTEKVVNGKVMYKCDKCDKTYAKKYIKRHTYYHSNERPFVCKLCARTYKTVSDIMRHGFRAHSGIKLLCTYKCGFSTAYTGALKEHEDKVHKNMFKYTCDKCGKGFSVKTWFEQHQNVHTGLKPYVCDICGVAFHMDKYLTSHRSAMHPQSLSKRPLICVHCDLKCDSVNTLALHLENDHGVLRSKGKKMKKKTLCDFCGKILNRPEQLLFHRRMHLGEKPYKCSVCNKAFSRKFSMQVHERAHALARPHACAHCGKLYSQPSALYRHQRLHHGLTRKRAW